MNLNHFYRKIFHISTKIGFCVGLVLFGIGGGRFLFPHVEIVEVEVEVFVEVEKEIETDQTDSPSVAIGGAEVPFDSYGQSGGIELLFPIAESDYPILTSPFGIRFSPIFKILLFHQGVDIATVWRAQVVAVADGVVVEHWPPPGTPHPNGGVFRGHPVYGGAILIEHQTPEGPVRTLYSHLNSTKVNSTTFRNVKAGQVIGRVGNTGVSLGDHLHFEVIVGFEDDSTKYLIEAGDRVNPLLFIPNPLDEDDHYVVR